MRIEPKAPNPTSVTPGAQTPAQADARARAIAKLTGGTPNQSQETPVANPNNVSVEELSAISSGTQEEAPKDEQNNNGESSESPAIEEPKPEETKEEPLSAQYAVLARKEKALRAKAQAQDLAFKAREEALRVREEALTGKASSFDESKYIPRDRLKQETLNVLAEEGISYEELTNAILTQQSSNTDPRVLAEIKALKSQLSQYEELNKKTAQSIEDNQKQSYQQAVNQIRNETKSLVTTDDNFELIRHTNSVDDVVELIERTFKEDGVLMTVSEAAKQVEDYLTEEATKLARSKKIQQRLSPKPTTAQGAPKPTETNQAKQPQSAKTLTNSHNAARPLTAKERAILAFKGELKR